MTKILDLFFSHVGMVLVLRLVYITYAFRHCRRGVLKISPFSQSCLEFSLRIQEFIELIRQNKRMDAVRYGDRLFCNLSRLRAVSLHVVCKNDLLCVVDMHGNTSAKQKAGSWMRFGRSWACWHFLPTLTFPHTRWGSSEYFFSKWAEAKQSQSVLFLFYPSNLPKGAPETGNSFHKC